MLQNFNSTILLTANAYGVPTCSLQARLFRAVPRLRNGIQAVLPNGIVVRFENGKFALWSQRAKNMGWAVGFKLVFEILLICKLLLILAH